jgi:hypothetical protein
MQFRTRAPFHVNGRWIWRTWTNNHANKHAAIIEMGQSLGAVAWDYGQADHEEFSRAGF